MVAGSAALFEARNGFECDETLSGRTARRHACRKALRRATAQRLVLVGSGI
jgi:hypothetical protein